MKMRCVLLLGGVVLLGVNLAMASNVKPGMPTGLGGFAPQQSFCEGDFSNFNGICFFYEEPDNAEQQDFSLGTPNVQTGIVDIVEPDGVTLSDSLDFYLNPNDGFVHVLFQSDGFAQGGGLPVCCENGAGNWVYFVGNEYDGVSPPEVPEPSSLILLGSGVIGLASVLRRKLF